jgi:hypothetical protein
MYDANGQHAMITKAEARAVLKIVGDTTADRIAKGKTINPTFHSIMPFASDERRPSDGIPDTTEPYGYAYITNRFAIVRWRIDIDAARRHLADGETISEQALSAAIKVMRSSERLNLNDDALWSAGEGFDREIPRSVDLSFEHIAGSASATADDRQHMYALRFPGDDGSGLSKHADDGHDRFDVNTIMMSKAGAAIEPRARVHASLITMKGGMTAIRLDPYERHDGVEVEALLLGMTPHR